MGQFGPFETRVEIIERATRFVDLMIRNRDDNVTAYKVFGHRSLNDAYGDPTSATSGGTSKVLGTGPVEFIPYIGREQGFRSPLLIRRGLGRLISRSDLRRMSRVMFDPEDYASLPAMPSEEEILFVRTQEFAVTSAGFRTVLGPVNTGDAVLGPIVVIPSASFYGSPNAPLILSGLAPANTQAVVGAVTPVHEGGQDPNPMHIVFPRPGTVTLTNLSSTTDLLYSVGLGTQMGVLPTGAPPLYLDGGIKELLLASADNAGAGALAVAFSLSAIVNLGVEL